MKKKTFALILTLCMTLTAVISFTAGAAATGGLQEIKAYLNSTISIKLDGEEQVLMDANGVRLYPISYNNSTYLPVRALSNMVGLGVDYDQATQTIFLGKQPGGIDLIDTYNNYQAGRGVTQYQTGNQDPQDISGIKCSRWIEYYFRGNGERYTDISFNLGGKHDTLTCSYYATDDIVFQVLGDKEQVLCEINITGGEVAQTVTIPLFKTNQLTLRMKTSLYTTNAYVFDAYLDAE